MLSTNRKTTTADAAMSEQTPFSRMYAWTDVTPTTAVVETVADAAGVGAMDLEPLRNVVDPDALDKLAQPGQHGGGRDLRVSFSYHDYFVVVRQTGRVTLYDLED